LHEVIEGKIESMYQSLRPGQDIPALENALGSWLVGIMKLRHAAALALVGWYLMLPPPAPSGGRLRFERLSEWRRIETFDSKNACQHMRSKLIKRMPDTLIATARCVSSDNPDLLPEFGPIG
jgi:hypothetical protein